MFFKQVTLQIFGFSKVNEAREADLKFNWPYNWSKNPTDQWRSGKLSTTSRIQSFSRAFVFSIDVAFSLLNAPTTACTSLWSRVYKKNVIYLSLHLKFTPISLMTKWSLVFLILWFIVKVYTTSAVSTDEDTKIFILQRSLFDLIQNMVACKAL